MVTCGVFFWILALLAVTSMFMFVGRFVELRRAGVDGNDFVKGVVNVLERGGADEALAICDDTQAPVAAIVATAIRQRRAPARILREAVDAQGRAEIGRLDRRLASLALIGQVAPSVGLLGTIVGFIRTLDMANSSAVVTRPELLNVAVGALVSAAAGIAVSVVITVFYGMLRVRLDRLVLELEASASRILGYFATGETSL